MQQIVRHILVVVSFTLLLSACSKVSDPSKTLEAEHIKYEVIYLENMAGDIPTKMLPDVMDAYYTNKYIKTSISGFFGQFSLIQIANLRQNNVISLLNFFGNKVYYVGEKGEIPAGILPIENPDVSFTTDSKNICGFDSKKAVVKTDKQSYPVYYIEDLDIKNPNIATPYEFIDYVLSDFRVQLSVLKMHLIMQEHESVEIEQGIFDIPEDYKQVSKKTMEDIINNLFTKE